MMLTGVTDAWVILISFLVAVIFVLRVRWTVALLLFFFGPIAGTLMTLLVQMAGHIGEAHQPGFLWLVGGVYALDFTGVLIGSAVGGLLAALILLLASLAHQSPELIDFVSGGTRDRLDPSTEIL